MRPFWAYLASLEHFIVLNSTWCTFLVNSSWFEVACQYSSLPYECVASRACLSWLLQGLEANPVTGDWSSPLRTNWTLSALGYNYSEQPTAPWWFHYRIPQPIKMHHSRTTNFRLRTDLSELAVPWTCPRFWSPDLQFSWQEPQEFEAAQLEANDTLPLLVTILASSDIANNALNQTSIS